MSIVADEGPAKPARASRADDQLIQVTRRPEAGDGVYEVAVAVGSHGQSSSLVVASPRRFAFRKAIVETGKQ